jgi:aspartate/methionine/tyrosine aminotransferase
MLFNKNKKLSGENIMPIPKCSEDLTNLPPYVFIQVAKFKNNAIAKGKDIIEFAQGNPDTPTPKHIVESVCDAVTNDPTTHRYPTFEGIKPLRDAIAGWYKRKYDVDIDPDTEVLPLIGSKEGLGHLYCTYVSDNDYIVSSNPSYPAHYFTVNMCPGKLHMLPINEENNFMMDLKAIPQEIADKTKILILNYPNNPTGRTIDDGKIFDEAINFAKDKNMMVLNDFAYSEIYFDDYYPPSIMQHPEAKKYCLEYNSLSKSYNMAGWRIGWVVGNAEIIGNLKKYKSFIDYGISGFIQKAAVTALTGDQKCVEDMRKIYQGRRDAMYEAFKAAGWELEKPRATLYFWAKLPEKCKHMKSIEFVEKLIMEEGVVFSPGSGFGPHGEGYVRIALVESEEKIKEAGKRLERFLSKM